MTPKGYWVICISSYTIDGIAVPKGRMHYHTSIHPIVSNNWRVATEKEIEGKKIHKGNFYNLNLQP